MQSSGGSSLAESLGITTSSIVLELGFDDDSSQEIRDAFVAASGNAIVDEDYSDVVWLMTPKPGREGHVTPADIADAAPTAGLQVTRTLSASKDWQGTRLVIPKGNRR